MADASTLMLLTRLVVSMSLVIALMLGLAHIAKRRGYAPGGSRGPKENVQVEVLARRTLARGSSVAIVRTAGKALVLGVTEHQVTTLAEADINGFGINGFGVDDFEFDEPEGAPAPRAAKTSKLSEAQRTVLPGGQQPGPTWKAMLDQLREKTVRH